MVPVQTKRLSVKEINIAIRGRLAWDTILITDKHRSYASFAEKNNIHLCQLLGKEYVHKSDPTVNVQLVNNLHSRFKRFIKPFFGVSSKYIGNYANWFLYLKRAEKSVPNFKTSFIAKMLDDQGARNLYQLYLRDMVTIRA